MDRAGETALHSRSRIVNRIIAKRHIADNRVKIVIGKLRIFKAFFKYCGVGVEFPGNPGGDGVKFNPCPMSPLHSLRHKPEKMPYPHSRFKHFNVFPQAKLLKSSPYRVDD